MCRGCPPWIRHCLFKSVVSAVQASYGVFTLADTDTKKMGLQPICICVGVCVIQSEQFCIL